LLGAVRKLVGPAKEDCYRNCRVRFVPDYCHSAVKTLSLVSASRMLRQAQQAAQGKAKAGAGCALKVRLQGSSQTEAAPRFNNYVAATPGPPGSRRGWV
jgi:hypothetical protein